jgi:hypothetical protein
MKSRSLSKESATWENVRGGVLALGRAESPGLGASLAAPRPCDCELGGAVFDLEDSAREALVAPDSGAEFLVLGELGAFAWLGESLAPPGLGGLDALGGGYT